MDFQAFQEGMQTKIRLRVINVLRKWFNVAYDDFSDKLKEFVDNFINETLIEDSYPQLALSLYSKTRAREIEYVLMMVE